ncbi:MAG: hypothetical protein JO022_02465 [Acidobacteriaceae bacterium]|nr:hypothetical protein [Acidobacteriaceae bacterium]
MRTAIGLILRVYAYLFHMILSLFLIGIALIADATGKPLKMDVLPWEGMKLNHWVLALGVLGILSVVLAITGLFRYLFPLWAFVVFVMLLRGFFLTPYSFNGNFDGAAWFTLGAFGAFLSSLAVIDRRNRVRPNKK